MRAMGSNISSNITARELAGNNQLHWLTAEDQTWIIWMVRYTTLKVVLVRCRAKLQRRCKTIWITAIGKLYPRLITGTKMHTCLRDRFGIKLGIALLDVLVRKCGHNAFGTSYFNVCSSVYRLGYITIIHTHLVSKSRRL